MSSAHTARPAPTSPRAIVIPVITDMATLRAHIDAGKRQAAAALEASGDAFAVQIAARIRASLAAAS